MSNDGITQTINQILQGLMTQLNGEIGSAICHAGYDPYQNLASGSGNVGAGKATYYVTDLTGMSSVQFNDMVASNITGSSTLTGQLNFDAVLNSSLNARVGGDVKLYFADPGISGRIRIDGPSISGSAQFTASMSDKLCLNKITNLNADFNYTKANIWIDNLGPLEYLMEPVKSLILDAAKNAIRVLTSSQISSIVSQQINRLLPQCSSPG